MAGEGFEEAALAFDQDSGAAPARSEKAPSGPVEALFGNVGVLDDDSPAAGGDDMPVKTRTKAPVAEFGPDDGDDDPNLEDLEGDENVEEDVDPAKKEDEDDEDVDDIYEVMIDGEKAEVPLREALDGYIRMETFHRRMSYLNDVKAEVAARAQEVVQIQSKYTDLVETMQKHLEMLTPKEPDWDAEYARDPQGARALQKKYEEYKTTMAALEAEKARVKAEQDGQLSRESADYIKAENRKILANNPSWKDEKIMQRDLSLMSKTAETAGFTKEEISSITDSRMVTVLLKAAKYDRLQEKKPKPVRRGSKPISSGAGTTRTAPKGGQAMKQLQRTGSVDAAASVFTNLISPNRRK
jgi:hypothetical protein